MRPEVEQELAHTLLVELLAYQFASPVRWIETQDVFLAERTSERIVEVGPADTLGVMAKRTIASKYEAYDAAKSVQRQILCYNKDAKEIYYDVDPEEEESEALSAAGGVSSAPAPASAAPAPAAVPAAPSSGPAAQVPDAPLQAVDVVRSLIAQKLKKPFLEIPLSKAIKDLVGGKLACGSHGRKGFCADPLSFQASLRYRTKSSETWAKSLVRRPRNQKIRHWTSWARRCKRRSMAISARPRRVSSLA